LLLLFIYSSPFLYRLRKLVLTLSQELACKLLEMWDKAVYKAFSDNALKAYLYSAIRNQLLKMVPRKERETSLEALPEETFTIELVCDEDLTDIIIEAVHAALRKCTPIVQAYAVKAYKLTDYQPATKLPEATKRSIRTRCLKRNFSKDEKILALIEDK
jgi:hypothetical protein